MSDGIPTSQEELLEEVRGASESVIEKLRQRGRKDLFFFSKGIIGYKDVNRSTHLAFCRFIQSEPRKRRLALMPRFHLKTSIATECDSMRVAIDSEGDARILIVNEIDKNARDILSVISGHFRENELLRFLYGHLIPERFAGPGVQWNSEGLTLLRARPYKEPTFMAIGIEGAVTSKHFTHIKADDLIGLEARRSPAKMLAAKTWVDNVEALVVSAVDTTIDFIGTRWMKNDVYAHIMEFYGAQLATFRRMITEVDKETGEEYIIFPEKIDWEFIRRLQKKPDVYFAQFRNDPLASETLDFDITQVQTATINPLEGKIRAGNREYDRRALDVVMAVDPNGGSKTAPDEAAYAVSGLAHNGDQICLESWGGRPSPDEFISKLVQAIRRWKPRVVGVEKAGQQTTDFYLEKKLREEGIGTKVEIIRPGGKHKEDRIRDALSDVISSGQLYLLATQLVLRKQIEDFPAVDNDDRIEALANTVPLHRKPAHAEKVQKVSKDLIRKIMASRSRFTGY